MTKNIRFLKVDSPVVKFFGYALHLKCYYIDGFHTMNELLDCTIIHT